MSAFRVKQPSPDERGEDAKFLIPLMSEIAHGLFSIH